MILIEDGQNKMHDTSILSYAQMARVYISQSRERSKSKFSHQRNFSFFLLLKAGEMRRKHLAEISKIASIEPMQKSFLF